MAKEIRRATKKKAFKNIASGGAHVNSSFNNTKIYYKNPIIYQPSNTKLFINTNKKTKSNINKKNRFNA